MQDIIEMLTEVYRGLDRLTVAGVKNAQMLGACGDGVSAAIRALRQLDVRARAAAESTKTADAAAEVDHG